MQPIIQEDRTGCGIASVASLAGVSYQHVKRQQSKQVSIRCELTGASIFLRMILA
jgi:hypothetical protein